MRQLGNKFLIWHTGTLTLNQLSVDKPTCMVIGEGRTLDEVLKWGALSANIVSEEPIDVVMHEAYDGNATLWDNYTLQKFIPFNPTDKYTIAIVKDNKTGEVTRIMKGAPQVRATIVCIILSANTAEVISKCPLKRRSAAHLVSKGATWSACCSTGQRVKHGTGTVPCKCALNSDVCGDGQVVLKKAYNYAEIGDAVHNKITEFAGRGFRALGVATAPDDGTDGKYAFLLHWCA